MNSPGDVYVECCLVILPLQFTQMPTIASTLDVDVRRSSMLHNFVKEESKVCREAQNNE